MTESAEGPCDVEEIEDEGSSKELERGPVIAKGERHDVAGADAHLGGDVELEHGSSRCCLAP